VRLSDARAALVCGVCSASNPKLAETLQTVATEGVKAFYDPNSTLAQNLVKDIQAKGGIITLQDLSSYYYNSTVKVAASHLECLFGHMAL
jgi:gamma-glutamyltranspeptidase